jgi:anti-sigma factor RsiW
MTAEFKSQNQNNPNFQEDSPTLKSGDANQSIGGINMLKRDRFELLSAYLDGEVTAAERRQVENWLANEPEVQQLYARLLKLRQELRTLPVPPAEQSVEQTIQQVFRRINRRLHLTVICGGTAIAALFVGAVPGILPSRQFAQIVQSPQPVAAPAETLMVALNTPVVEIPKAAVAAPENAVKQTVYTDQQSQDSVH